jgi:Ca2+/Na+ antiporter
MAKPEDDHISLAKLLVLSGVSLYVTFFTVLFSWIRQWEVFQLVVMFTVFVVTVIVFLCLDEEAMWDEEDQVSVSCAKLATMRKQNPVGRLPVSPRWFIGAWFVWLSYAHLLGENSFSSMGGFWFSVLKSLPAIVSWVFSCTRAITMRFESAHFAVLFLVAAISVVPHPSVMAPQVTWIENGVRALAACSLFVGTNVLLFGRYTRNYNLYHNRVYLGPLLVFWVFFVPSVTLFSVIINCLLLGVMNKRDTTGHYGFRPDEGRMSPGLPRTPDPEFGPQDHDVDSVTLVPVYSDEDSFYEETAEPEDTGPPRIRDDQINSYIGLSEEEIMEYGFNPVDRDRILARKRARAESQLVTRMSLKPHPSPPTRSPTPTHPAPGSRPSSLRSGFRLAHR